MKTSQRWLVGLTTLLMSFLASGGAVRAQGGASFNDLVKALRKGADGDSILRSFPTVFTFDERQLRVLDDAGASPELIEALQAARANLSDVRNIVLILDCSGSMADTMPDGKTRMAAAKEAVGKLLHLIPEGRNVGFIVYGYDAALECDSVKVAFPLQAWNSETAAKVENFVRTLEPMGHTPIARALRSAGMELLHAEGLSQLVLITDGLDTCGGDPAGEAEKLVTHKRLKIRSVDVVGLGLDEKETKGVMEIARRGKGKFAAAKDSKELIRGVEVASGLRVQETPVVKEAQEPVAGPTQRTDVKFSTDPAGPAELELGKYAFCRIGAKNHYWAVDLAPGEYKVIVDGHRLSEEGLSLWVNEYKVEGGKPVEVRSLLLAQSSAIDGRFRSTCTIKVDQPGRKLLRVQNTRALHAYALAVVPVDEPFTVPYFVETPPIKKINLGSSFTYDRPGKGWEDFFALDLPDADFYRVKIKFENLSAKPHRTGGYLAFLATDGESRQKFELGTTNAGAPVYEREAKMSVDDRGSFLLRVQHYTTDPQRVTITIRKWAE